MFGMPWLQKAADARKLIAVSGVLPGAPDQALHETGKVKPTFKQGLEMPEPGNFY